MQFHRCHENTQPCWRRLTISDWDNVWNVRQQPARGAAACQRVPYQTKDFHPMGRVELCFRQRRVGCILTSLNTYHSGMICRDIHMSLIASRSTAKAIQVQSSQIISLPSDKWRWPWRVMVSFKGEDGEKKWKSFAKHSDRWNFVTGDVVVFDQFELHEL